MNQKNNAYPQLISNHQLSQPYIIQKETAIELVKNVLQDYSTYILNALDEDIKVKRELVKELQLNLKKQKQELQRKELKLQQFKGLSNHFKEYNGDEQTPI